MEWQARGRQQQRVQGKWRRRLPPSADALFHGATFWKGAQMIVAYSLTIRAGLPIIAAGALGLVLLVRSRFLAKACVNVTNLTILCERVLSVVVTRALIVLLVLALFWVRLSVGVNF